MDLHFFLLIIFSLQKFKYLSCWVERGIAIGIVYFITVKQHWKYKKGNYITFDSIFFLCVGWVGKEQNTIQSDINVLFHVFNDD